MVWLVVLGFNTTLTAKVISWQSVTHMCFLAFSHQYKHNFSSQRHQLLFSHGSAEVRGENMLERKVASTGNQTHNHQVMSLTRSPLSHPGRTSYGLEEHMHTHTLKYHCDDCLAQCKVAELTLSQTTNSRLFQTQRVCRRQFQI